MASVMKDGRSWMRWPSSGTRSETLCFHCLIYHPSATYEGSRDSLCSTSRGQSSLALAPVALRVLCMVAARTFCFFVTIDLGFFALCLISVEDFYMLEL